MQYVTFAIAIIGSVISVSSFVLNRKDKSNKDIKEEQKQFDKNNLIEYRLTKIEQNIEKILNKVNDELSYDDFDELMLKKQTDTSIISDQYYLPDEL